MENQLQKKLSAMLENKRVLFIANEYTTILQFRKELITFLEKNGYEVGVSVPKSDHDDEIKKLGCTLFYSSVKRHSVNPFSDLKYKKELINTIKNFKPSICLSFTIKPNIYGSIVCKKLKVPIISNVTGLGDSIVKKGPLRTLSLFLYKKGLKSSNWVFFQNSSNMDFMIKNKIVGRDRCSLLPGSGVNLMLNPFEEYPKNAIVSFVYIGRMIKSKGILELLESIKIIKKTYNVNFVLVGELDNEFKDEILKLSKLKLLEYVPYQNDIHGFLKKANCIIHPSYHEGMSNVLLEAAASGRPILASNIPGCREIVDDGINGFLFQPKSTIEIVSSIKKFLALSEGEMSAMGRNSYSKVKNEFDRNIVVNYYSDKICEVLKL